MAQDLIGPWMADYADKCVAALEAAGRPVGRVIHKQPGERMTWDDCCSGQLGVRVAAVQPLNADNPRTVRCGVTAWIVTFGISVIRCAHTVDDNGVAPSAAEVTSDGNDMVLDMQEIQQVILCHEMTRTFVAWRPLAVTGGCHGGEWTFTMRVEVCGC